MWMPQAGQQREQVTESPGQSTMWAGSMGWAHCGQSPPARSVTVQVISRHRQRSRASPWACMAVESVGRESKQLLAWYAFRAAAFHRPTCHAMA